MDRTRLTLNNPAFADRLRQPSRSPEYVRRPTPVPTRVIQDISLQPLKQSAAAGAQKYNPVKQFSRARSTVVPQLAAAQLKQVVQPTVSQPKHQIKIAHRKPQKSAVLRRRGLLSPLTPAKKTRILHKRPTLLYAMAAMIFIIGVVVSLNGLRANRQVAAQVKQISNQSDSSGKANGATPPSTTKPSAASIANYAVAPNLPKYVDIVKLGVHARILSMGVNSKNQLQAPGNVYDAGWYNGSSQPGQPGGMLLDGHISSWTTHGVFYGLNKLTAGDTIVITRGDNKTFTYTVVKTEIDDASSVDMSSLLVSQNTAKPGLSLISCSGDVIPGTNEFNKRIVIYAVES